MNADIEKITGEVDLVKLEGLLDNITYARLDRDDMERFGDEQFATNFLKLFRLSQMSIEYLVYTQNYLECLTRALDMQYKNAYEQTAHTKEKIRKCDDQLKRLRTENQIKQKTLATYEYLIKIPKDGDNSQAVKCKHCPKFFASEQFLKNHYAKRHPGEHFENDFPSQSTVAKQKEISQKELADQQRQEQ